MCNSKIYCWASELNKWNLGGRSLDISFFFRYILISSFKNPFSRAQGLSFLPMFHGNFCGLLCLHPWLDYSAVEIPLSAIANLFEMACQSKASFAIVTKSALVTLQRLLPFEFLAAVHYRFLLQCNKMICEHIQFWFLASLNSYWHFLFLFRGFVS